MQNDTEQLQKVFEIEAKGKHEDEQGTKAP